MSKNNNDDNYNRFLKKLEKSVLDIEDLNEVLIEEGIKYYYKDAPIIQAYKLFDFIEEESEKDKENNEKNIVWIRDEEWTFENEGVNYGMIFEYNRYSKNGEDYLLLKILYSSNKIKLIRARLDANDPVTRGIIRTLGNRFDLDEILDLYVRIHIKNQVDENCRLFSKVTGFSFVPEDELAFIDDMYHLIQNKTIDPDEEI